MTTDEKLGPPEGSPTGLCLELRGGHVWFVSDGKPEGGDLGNYPAAFDIYRLWKHLAHDCPKKDHVAAATYLMGVRDGALMEITKSIIEIEEGKHGVEHGTKG